MNELKNPLAQHGEDYEKYELYYSEKGLMDKLTKFAKKAGVKTVYAALLLYYVLLSEDVPMKEKGLIIGALGYLILPIDLIPDAIPVLGFTDDLAALAYVVHAVLIYISPEIEAQAKSKLTDWFGSVSVGQSQLITY